LPNGRTRAPPDHWRMKEPQAQLIQFSPPEYPSFSTEPLRRARSQSPNFAPNRGPGSKSGHTRPSKTRFSKTIDCSGWIGRSGISHEGCTKVAKIAHAFGLQSSLPSCNLRSAGSRARSPDGSMARCTNWCLPAPIICVNRCACARPYFHPNKAGFEPGRIANTTPHARQIRPFRPSPSGASCPARK